MSGSEEQTPLRGPARQQNSGSEEASETQGLLESQSQSQPAHFNEAPPGYYAAHVEDSGSGLRSSFDVASRASVDSLDYLASPTASPSRAGPTRNRPIEQMEIMEPAREEGASNRIKTIFSTGFSSISRRFGQFAQFNWLPSFRIRMPQLERPSWPSGWAIPEEWRPKWFILARLAGLLVLITLLYILFSIPDPSGSAQFNPETVRLFVQSSISGSRIKNSVRRLSMYDHVAGTKGGFYMTRQVQSAFDDTDLEQIMNIEYPVYLNYPISKKRFLGIVEPKKKEWTASLDEEEIYKDSAPHQQQMPVFHGYAKAGTARGPLVYANYGSARDFDALRKDGLLPKGAIALIRALPADHASGPPIKNAELAGCAGAILYVDPTDEPAGLWPDGQARAFDSVYRSSAALTNWLLGDPLTPGWASTAGGKRINKQRSPALPNIPTMPISLKDSRSLLESIKGVGKEAPGDWRGAVPSIDKYWTGGKGSPIVKITVAQEEPRQQRIWNIIGEFRGHETGAKKVVIGSPRDAWCFGASAPGSGTAIMLEVLNVFNSLHAQGWRPLRTIEFASWDASQYNLVGSTEYIEDRLDRLRDNTVAYINLGRGISGDNLDIAGTPSLLTIIEKVLGRINDPSSNGTSLRQSWTDANESPLRQLTVDGDYAGYQYMVGAPTIDIAFTGRPHPHQSCYDVPDIMDNLDPDYTRHKALGQLVALLVLELSQEPMVPVDLARYATSMKRYSAQLAADAAAVGPKGRKLDLSALQDAIERFQGAADGFHAWEEEWLKAVFGGIGFETGSQLANRARHNEDLIAFGRGLLDDGAAPGSAGGAAGLPGRTQFQHAIFGPPLLPHSLSAGAGSPLGPEQQERVASSSTFPFVRHRLLAGDWEGAQAEVGRTAWMIRRAVSRLTIMTDAS